MPRNKMFNVFDRFQSCVVTDFQELTCAPGFVPTNVTNFWNDDQVGVSSLLIGNDALDGDEGLS